VPFGLVDADLKAYLRSAHVTLQEKVQEATRDDRVARYDDEVKTLRNAMLDEVKGKELILATDTDTSVILEGMLPSFGERQARILCDALEREACILACHRFGSHVLQSALVALQPFISESDAQDDSSASLRSARQLVVDITHAVQQKALDVMQNQFGTHVLRTLLLILSGKEAAADTLRSKRSSSFKKKANENGTVSRAKDKPSQSYAPWSFDKSRRALITTLKQALCSEESLLRSMCVDPISGPTLALLVESDDEANDPANDMLDKCLGGLQHASRDDERSAHVETLLRDPVGSHVLESLLRPAATPVLERFWTVYVHERFIKLAAHPVANFVVSALIKRLADEKLIVDTCKMIAADGEDGKLVKSGHMGIFIALLDCAKAQEQQRPLQKHNVRSIKETFWSSGRLDCCAMRAIFSSFGLSDFETLEKSEEKVLGGSIFLLLGTKTVAESKAQRKKARLTAKRSKQGREGKKDGKTDEGEVKITLQGSLLCQSIARLASPANQPFLSSLLRSSAFLRICCDASGVHVVLAALQSSQLAFSQRTQLCAKVLENVEPFSNDKYGSRVIDATFDTADMYFKDKMARTCLTLERQLLASTYGRFFLKNIQIGLYRRDVEAWKQEIRTKSDAKAKNGEEITHRDIPSSQKTKKGARKDDELDEILEGAQ
jgi:nucleolar protein 9